VTTCGTPAAGTPRFTPGTGVPYAGYGSVYGWLAGGKLESGCGSAAGPGDELTGIGVM
jgi:hypothetical protein